MAFNQVALITIPSVTIWIDSGVYLEDPVLRNVSVTALYIRCKDNVDSIDASTADLPVKVRSVGFFFVRGYIQVTGLQFIDTANGPDFSGSIYQLLANDNRNSSSMAVYAGGTTQCHIYGNTYFYRQNIAIWAKLMGTILISSIIGSQNTTGARCDDGVIRREPPIGFADIQTKVTGCGLYITKGTTL